MGQDVRLLILVFQGEEDPSEEELAFLIHQLKPWEAAARRSFVRRPHSEEFVAGQQLKAEGGKREEKLMLLCQL